MKTSILTLLAVFCIFQLSNCVESTADVALDVASAIVQNHAQVKGSGNLTEKEIKSSDFSSIENATSFDIEIKQGDKQNIKVLTDDNIQDFIYFQQTGEKITFSIQKKASFEATKSIIYITVVNLKSIISSGTGDIEIGKLSTDEFKIENYGTGDIKYLSVSNKTLSIINSGTGDVKLEGNIENIIIENSGTGDISAQALKADVAKLTNSGTGDVSITAVNDLSIDNSGTGDVTYYGTPQNKTINSSGVGEVIKKE
ncbi:MAG: hypothetical protein A2046_08205 [Bacteroidetes bacterium GWA2_30_7]|nr:MAG: hypothetical protein A2046_08205 [Bacteroidetes bacterium GWA2_30_7]